jgi:hypothetical protein
MLRETRFEQAVRTIAVRQIAAKTLIKTGITVPPPARRGLDSSMPAKPAECLQNTDVNDVLDETCGRP